MIEDGISASMGGSNRANSLDNNWFSGGAPNGVDAGGPIHRRDQHRRLDPKTRRLYEGSDDMVERFTVLINLCIEDIEYFCSDVREIKAAADAGGGAPRPGAPRMEDLQATDFTQIFQKFKLSFNLLVRFFFVAVISVDAPGNNYPVSASCIHDKSILRLVHLRSSCVLYDA